MKTPYSFLAVSDVHLGWKLFNLPELAQDLLEDFEYAVDEAIRLKVDYFFVVGDLFDTNRPSPDLVYFVSQQVRKLGANGCIAAGIAGDHDKPVNNAAWINLGNVLPINSLNDPRFVGFDYCDNSVENVDRLLALPKKEKVEWIFLHGQVPELFHFTEEKKRLDLNRLDLAHDFTALKGVILGDIHTPLEGELYDPFKIRETNPYIGYCGSLGMIKTSEFNYKRRLLHFDGQVLQKIPFKLSREFIKVDLATAHTPINWIQRYTRFFTNYEGKKPLIVVEYDKESKDLLATLSPLYDVAIVRTTRSNKTAKTSETSSEEEHVSLRSELKTVERIESVLKKCIPDRDIFELTFQLLKTEDPSAILDKYKEEKLNE